MSGGTQLRETRRDYFHAGAQPDMVVAQASWTPRFFRNMPVATGVPVAPSGTVFGGVTVRGGAAAVTVTVYDAANDADCLPVGPLTDANVIGFATAAAGGYDGFVNLPVAVSRGVRFVVDQADALVAIYYRAG